MRKLVYGLLLLVTLAACNTIQGIGRDIEVGGAAVNDAASSTKEKMRR